MIDWTPVAVLGVQAVIGLFSHISLHKKLNTAAQARLQIGQELAQRIATPELAKEDLNAIAQKGAADALAAATSNNIKPMQENRIPSAEEIRMRKELNDLKEAKLGNPNPVSQ